MSELLRHKMIDFEVQPLPTAWQAISARLEDDIQYSVLSGKMNGFETTPPAISWEAISTRLNDDNQYSLLSARMNDFDTTPPSSAWDTIAARLHDDEQYSDVSARMNDFDAVPPPQIWNNVLNALEETKIVKTSAPVINIKSVIYRIAAAVAIVGFFIGGWIIINRKNSTNEVVKNTAKTVPVQPLVNSKADRLLQANSAANQKNDNVAVQNNHKDQYTIKNNPSALPVNGDKETDRHALVNNSSSNHKTPSSSVTAPPLLDKDGNPIMDIDVLNTSNYIIVAGPNGQLTRISSKFANVIRFLNDDNSDKNVDTEEYLDKVIKESSTWKKRFQEWRSKISQSSYIPSSVNFLDIEEFKDLIQEKK